MPDLRTIAHRLRRLAGASRWIFGLAALVFIVLAAIGSRDVFATVLSRASLGPLVAAVGLWTLLHLLTPVFSWLALRELGAAIDYRTALGIHVARLPARYLPGGIWHTVSRVVDLSRTGVKPAQLSNMVVLENVIPLAMAALMGGMFITGSQHHRSIGIACAGLGALLLLGAILVSHHRWARRMPAVKAAGLARLAAVAAVFWLFAASAFACYWSAFPAPEGGVGLQAVFGSYLLAWAAGFAAVFAPQGIGVFEAVIAWLLQGSLPFAGVVLLAAGFRATVLAADLLAHCALLLLRMRGRAERRSQH